ncbi:DUF4269 domain-containing protein [Labrys sp. ZIDIC5]|uniref:DUF4269 domain-containing protein n=1 Tax=Labrys sedimenti TaxID=3106036 RepID=UPI002ACA086C|nr:DUF4269 domain-containing protein [Labrys sp. ZIDIC5]MDZ5451860.1 DUF4269 domain-containing protein [Labrys sp. ZIDIC5]
MRPRPDYAQALRETGLLELLRPFDPHVAGTPPLGIDLPSSDIDILCHAPDQIAFTQAVWSNLAASEAFSMHQWTGDPRPVVVGLIAQGWHFELFASPHPVAEQEGWRHFLAERRLLVLGGEPLRMRIMQHRLAGLKTEPAFAAALNLAGDPYQALLDLQQRANRDLAAILSAAGYPISPEEI